MTFKWLAALTDGFGDLCLEMPRQALSAVRSTSRWLRHAARHCHPADRGTAFLPFRESPAARRMSLSFLSVEQPRWLAAVASLVLFCGVCPAMSDPGPEIESKGRKALADLVAHDQRTRALVERAAGILVMPDMVEMAFGVGGEYGEGVLLVDDKAVAYYALAAAPLRLEPRPKNKAHVLVFLTRQALIDFRNTQGWEVGIHGNVPLLDHTVELPVETSATADTTVGFLFTEKGLLSGFDLSGGRFSRIAR